MKSKIVTVLLLGCTLASLLLGCGNIEKTDVEEAITKELDQLKNLETDTVQKYVSSENLFPETENSTTKVPENAETVVLEFFEKFDYKILDLTTKDDTASADIRLNTIDAQTLAKDFATLHLQRQIAAVADSKEAVPLSASDMQENFELLHELLEKNDYGTVENNYTLNLVKSKNTWIIQKDSDLENVLVGGFITSALNPNLLTPAETAAIHLDMIQNMDTAQMSNYLGIDQVLSEFTDERNELASTLVEQVHKCFDYQLGETTENGIEATVETTITTFDYASTLQLYEKQLDEYLATPQALYDGEDGRYEKSQELLLKCIADNKATTSNNIPLHLTNNGAFWHLQITEDLATAIFGDFGGYDTDDSETEDMEDKDSEEEDDSSDTEEYENEEEYEE